MVNMDHEISFLFVDFDVVYKDFKGKPLKNRWKLKDSTPSKASK